MSMFASHTTKTIPIPSEVRPDGTPHEATIRKLSGKQLQVASDAVSVDRLTAIVRAGLIRWTLETPVTPDTLEDLDAEALNYFSTEIMRLTKPALFETAEEQETAQKNA